ncbi:MAG TPA: hypothetical protein VHO67_22075 [Polyangia bacterium]|nr:hypothetical protein [Polyangia bacterium]
MRPLSERDAIRSLEPNRSRRWLVFAFHTRRDVREARRDAGIRQKVDSLPPQPATAPVAQVAQRQQVEALAIDAGQSLYDLERAIADGVRDVEAAIAIGDGRAEGTLTAVANSLDRLVNQQEQGVVAETPQGEPFRLKEAREPHVHGYDPSGKVKVEDPTGNPHFPIKTNAGK